MIYLFSFLQITQVTGSTASFLLSISIVLYNSILTFWVMLDFLLHLLCIFNYGIFVSCLCNKNNDILAKLMILVFMQKVLLNFAQYTRVHNVMPPFLQFRDKSLKLMAYCIYRGGHKLLDNRSLRSDFHRRNIDWGQVLDSLTERCSPILKEREDFNDLWFQHNGAPPHFAKCLRDFLDQTFPRRWLGRRGCVDRPPRSPDLMPLDIFFWGAAKEYVYKERLTDVEDMKRRITGCFFLVNNSPNLCQKVCRRVRNRCDRCVDAGGLHLEHL